jgi:DNA mismatch endonuclease (patch repair protein)
VADIVDRATRSRMMAGIRGVHTKPERIVRSFLHRAGLRFRLHARDLPGRPDIVLPKHRAVVEVRGCFWHRHPGCRYATTPASNAAFWKSKFEENVRRDRRNRRSLRQAGWRVFVIWECQVAGDARLSRLVERIVSSNTESELR